LFVLPCQLNVTDSGEYQIVVRPLARSDYAGNRLSDAELETHRHTLPAATCDALQ